MLRRWADRWACLNATTLTSSEASQILEFAIALPLLVVLVVAIFDFGQAFNLKHELRNAAREGARYGSSLPLSDITSGITPASVTGVWGLVDAYLVRSEINDCGLASAAPVWVSSTSTGTATAAACPANLTVTIERAYVLNSTIYSVNMDVICTKVSISYPYQWHFSRVIQLLVPGSTYGATLPVAADALMPNMQ